jgi:hypothetical protein
MVGGRVFKPARRAKPDPKGTFTVSTKGAIHTITDPTAFFAPIILGAGGHGGGFVPTKSSGVSVILIGWMQIIPALPAMPLFFSTTASASDGSFSLPDIPAALNSFVQDVSFLVNVHGKPFYRSGLFPRAHLSPEKTFDIFVFQPTIPASDGVSAGLISTGLEGGGLPGNTVLTANPWGISVVGDKSGADINFGIQLTPDTSPHLGVFFDLALHNWDIQVGFPADWCTNANAILAQIKAALQTDNSKANQLVSGTITKAFEGAPLNLSAAVTQKLLAAVSIQFTSLSLPNKHTWPLSNTSDKTIVVVPQLTLGFPRVF